MGCSIMNEQFFSSNQNDGDERGEAHVDACQLQVRELYLWYLNLLYVLPYLSPSSIIFYNTEAVIVV